MMPSVQRNLNCHPTFLNFNITWHFRRVLKPILFKIIAVDIVHHTQYYTTIRSLNDLCEFINWICSH